MAWRNVLGVDEDAAIVKATAGNSNGHANQGHGVAACIGQQHQK